MSQPSSPVPSTDSAGALAVWLVQLLVAHVSFRSSYIDKLRHMLTFDLVESPAKKWPGVFSKISLFVKYPYLLPTLIAAAVTSSGKQSLPFKKSS
jgi:hypothetical protein